MAYLYLLDVCVKLISMLTEPNKTKQKKHTNKSKQNMKEQKPKHPKKHSKIKKSDKKNNLKAKHNIIKENQNLEKGLNIKTKAK